MGAHPGEAVQLVEEGDVVDLFAAVASLPGWKVIFLRIRNHDEAITSLERLSVIEGDLGNGRLAGIMSAHARSFSIVDGPPKRASDSKLTVLLGTVLCQHQSNSEEGKEADLEVLVRAFRVRRS